MSKYTKTMRDTLAEMSEAFSKKQIKMAIGIASDPRYKQGNYSGAVRQIEKIKKGLASHPQVAAVLKRQNEDIQESGHDDVASAKNQVKVAMSALQKMETELGKLKDEDSLPTWWTNKVAVSVDKLDGMADYLDTQVEEVELDEKFKVGDKVKVKKGSLKSPSQRHYERTVGTIVKVYSDGDLKVNFGGNDDFSAPDKMFVKEEVELDEKREPFAVIDTADDDKVVGTASDEKGAKSIITSAELPPMKIKDKKTLKIVKVKKKQDIGYPLKEEETVVESWELDEMKMDDPKLLKIFDKLKKGSTVKIKIDSSISKGKDYREFTVTAKNIVGKGKRYEQEKITLKSKDNPTGVKHFLYNRDGKVTLAIGDMGASIADIKENKMSAYTAAITKGVK